MNLVAVFLLAFEVGLTLVTAQDTCSNDRLERFEPEEDFEPMWIFRSQLDCTDEHIDAATVTQDKNTYFFKGDYYWRLIDSRVAPGYPRLITQDFDGLPGYLDAALTWSDGRTFFFKGHQYWSFHNKDMDPNYPRNISEGFCGIPDDIDAAVLYQPNNLPYFLKGQFYYRYDGGDSCGSVQANHPLSITYGWQGMPTDIDAALQWTNGRTYFIKDGYYYRYKDEVENESSPAIPLHRNWGLKCEELKCRIPPSFHLPDREDNP